MGRAARGRERTHCGGHMISEGVVARDWALKGPEQKSEREAASKMA